MARITPTIVFMAIIAAYVHAQETQFNLLRALKPKRDSGEPAKPKRLPKAFSIQELGEEPLVVLSYHDAYMRSMESGKSMAVFIVRTGDKAVIKMINNSVKLWEANDFRRFVNIAVVGPDNPNYSKFEVVDPEIEMMAWYKRDGKWGVNRYVGMGAVKSIMDKMTKWIDEKDNWEERQNMKPRDTFKVR